jgi:hypothetical protein
MPCALRDSHMMRACRGSCRSPTWCGDPRDPRPSCQFVYTIQCVALRHCLSRASLDYPKGPRPLEWLVRDAVISVKTERALVLFGRTRVSNAIVAAICKLLVSTPTKLYVSISPASCQAAIIGVQPLALLRACDLSCRRVIR